MLMNGVAPRGLAAHQDESPLRAVCARWSALLCIGIVARRDRPLRFVQRASICVRPPSCHRAATFPQKFCWGRMRQTLLWCFNMYGIFSGILFIFLFFGVAQFKTVKVHYGDVEIH